MHLNGKQFFFPILQVKSIAYPSHESSFYEQPRLPVICFMVCLIAILTFLFLNLTLLLLSYYMCGQGFEAW